MVLYAEVNKPLNTMTNILNSNIGSMITTESKILPATCQDIEAVQMSQIFPPFQTGFVVSVTDTVDSNSIV